MPSGDENSGNNDGKKGTNIDIDVNIFMLLLLVSICL